MDILVQMVIMNSITAQVKLKLLQKGGTLIGTSVPGESRRPVRSWATLTHSAKVDAFHRLIISTCGIKWL